MTAATAMTDLPHPHGTASRGATYALTRIAAEETAATSVVATPPQHP